MVRSERRMCGLRALMTGIVGAALVGSQACAGGATGSEGAKPVDGGASGGAAGQGGVNATGGAGFTGGYDMYACRADTECSTRLETFMQSLRTPLTHGPRRLVAADCKIRPTDCPGPNFCECTYTIRGGSAVVPGVIGLGLAPCDVASRTTGCLLQRSDFPGCSSADSCPCFDTCTHAMALMDSDDARSFDAQARSTTCVYNGCRMVFRVGDHCLAGREPGPYAEYDCSLTDAEILRRAFPAPADAATPPLGCDGNVCTGVAVPGECLVGVGVCNDCYLDAAALTCPKGDGG